MDFEITRIDCMYGSSMHVCTVRLVLMYCEDKIYVHVRACVCICMYVCMYVNVCKYMYICETSRWPSTYR